MRSREYPVIWDTSRNLAQSEFDGASWFGCAASSAQLLEQKAIDFASSDNASPSSILSNTVDNIVVNFQFILFHQYRQVTGMKGVAS